MPHRKYLRELQKIAQTFDPCAECSISRGGHICVALEGPLGNRKVFVSCTPSDHRTTRNFERDMRQAAKEVGVPI